MNKEKNTSDREISISRLLNAPRELVWEVWTKPEHIANWWGPAGFSNTIQEMNFTVGGHWHFIMHGPDGSDFKNHNVFTEIVKPELIVFEHRSGPVFTSKTTFEKQGKKTLVTMRMTFETAEVRDYTVKQFGADEGSKQTFNRMEEYLAKNLGDAPFVIERTYNASVEKVWQAITDPEQMKKWYFDLPGFKAEIGYEFQFKGGKDPAHPYLHLCKITEVVPEKKLVYTWRYDGYEGNTFVSFELFPENGKTRLKLTHSGIETFPANPDFAKTQFEMGWTQIIGTSLKDFLEK